MRISVDIGEDDLKALDSIAVLENVSRSSLLRRAIGKSSSGIHRMIGARHSAYGETGRSMVSPIRTRSGASGKTKPLKSEGFHVASCLAFWAAVATLRWMP